MTVGRRRGFTTLPTTPAEGRGPAGRDYERGFDADARPLKKQKTVHGSEIREGKFAWRLELTVAGVRLIYRYPAGEQAFELPARLIPTLIAQLRRAQPETMLRGELR